MLAHYAIILRRTLNALINIAAARTAYLTNCVYKGSILAYTSEITCKHKAIDTITTWAYNCIVIFMAIQAANYIGLTSLTLAYNNI